MTYNPQNILQKFYVVRFPTIKFFLKMTIFLLSGHTPKSPPIFLWDSKRILHRCSWFFGARASKKEITAFSRAIASYCHKLKILGSEGFRSITNTGLNGGQEVPHYHMHLLGEKIGSNGLWKFNRTSKFCRTTRNNGNKTTLSSGTSDATIGDER